MSADKTGVLNRIFIPNNPLAPRLCPELAREIGLGESIILLQLEYWISISRHEYDGRRWTYQSIRTMKQTFSFWDIATINRKVKSLEEKQLILIRNYNKKAYDRTRWFALWTENLEKLTSIRVLQFSTGHNDTPVAADRNDIQKEKYIKAAKKDNLNNENVTNSNSKISGKVSIDKDGFVSRCKAMFLEEYYSAKGLKYLWNQGKTSKSGKDDKALGGIIAQLKQTFPDLNSGEMLEKIQKFWKLCCYHSPDWIRKSLDLCLINSKYQTIVTNVPAEMQIRIPINNGTKPYFDYKAGREHNPNVRGSDLTNLGDIINNIPVERNKND